MATETVANSENFTLGNNSEEDDVICPSCDAKIKRSQVADHCQVEMERLHSMQLRSTATDVTVSTATSTATTPTTATTQSQSGAETGQRKPWSVFQRVQRNRQSRQRQRTRKRATPPPPPPVPAANSATATSVSASVSAPTPATTAVPAEQVRMCPVCNVNFPQAQIHEHANECLRQNGQNGEQRPSSDDDDDSDEYEEYEWAGQKRIRVSTLVQGGYRALNLGQTIKYHNGQQGNDDEDDVNVDEDDTHIYGPTQYGEADVIPLANEDKEEGGAGVADADVTMYVRRLISSNETPKNHSSEAAAPATTEEMDDDSASLEPSTSQASRSNNNQQQIIESLKARLRLYEKQAQSKFKCLICIDDYKNPAISVSCWHVHCEQCWLQTLGARKLCPQCNSITTPKDLRRIYL
ncbi:hypothetical protein ACLKA6_005639 [Drosophila palustris]